MERHSAVQAFTGSEFPFRVPVRGSRFLGSTRSGFGSPSSMKPDQGTANAEPLNRSTKPEPERVNSELFESRHEIRVGRRHAAREDEVAAVGCSLAAHDGEISEAGYFCRRTAIEALHPHVGALDR